MNGKKSLALLILFMTLLTAGTVCAQTAASSGGQATPPPEKIWGGSFGAGLSLTSGNTETKNFNLAFDLLIDPKSNNLMKFNGLYLRGSQKNQTNVDRLRLYFRDEYTFSERVFFFGEMGYVRDPFKDIDYLLNPTGGIGYKLVDTERFKMQVDGGAGAVWEKNSLTQVHTSGSLNAGEALAFHLSDTAAITQSVTALWKMDDFEDALYHFAVGVATSLTKNSELKVELLDDFKNKTPSPEIKKNDVALVMSFVFKF